MRSSWIIISCITLIVASILGIVSTIHNFVPKIITWTKKNSLLHGSRRYFEWRFSFGSLFFLRYFYSWLLLIMTSKYSRWSNVSIIFPMSLYVFFFWGTSNNFCIASWLCFLICHFVAWTFLCLCLIVSQSRSAIVRSLIVNDIVQNLGTVLLHVLLNIIIS
jgi:hypothetical protein